MPSSSRFLALAAVATALAPSNSFGQSTGLEDMVGARAGQAEAELERRGYRNVGGEKGDDRSYAYWWSKDRHQCVTVATMDGRYSSVTATLPADCRMGAGPNDRRATEYDRRSAPSHGYVAGDELSRICRNEASARFDRRPSEVTANAPIQQRNGYIVQGWYDRSDGSKGTKFFNCRFDTDGRFLGVD
jgi:hypothetical protein